MTELGIILALILLNGVFAGAEIAILSVRTTRLTELVEAGRRGAGSVAQLRADPESFLATVQIGITVVGATAAAFGGAAVAEDVQVLIEPLPWIGAYAEQLAVGVVVGFVSFLSLVLGELVPKSLALRAGETYALLVGRPLRSLAWGARPLVWLLTGASNLVLRAFGDQTTFTEARLSKDELQQLVEEATTTGSVGPAAGEIAARALEFHDRDVDALMVPVASVVMLSVDAPIPEVAKLAVERPFARVPVYEGTRDQIKGFVNVREVLARAALDPSVTLGAFLHEVAYIPDTARAPDALRKLQAARTHLAVVIDERGTVTGLVTIEDLVEELVGEILSEDDPAPVGLRKEADGTWLFPGSTPLHEVARALDRDMPDGDYSTIAGLVIAIAERIPEAGEVFETEGLRLEVVEAGPRRVRRVRLRELA